MARPRTPVGAYGSIAVRRRGDRVIGETRIRDADGRLRHVRVTARTAAQARQVLKERLLDRPTFGSTRVLTPQSTFADLAEVWLVDLAIQRLAEGTKQNYRDQMRLHVLPAFEHYTLAEITTGRVEWFLKSQAAISSSRARQSRTLPEPALRICVAARRGVA
jgi:Phage integrase, N-terminal SAM-like domain